MTTAVLPWLLVGAAWVAAVLFGQTARTVPARRGRRTPPAARFGLAVSRAGPWLVMLLSAAGAAATGQWLGAAAVALAGMLVTAGAGLALLPR
jgi:hypothetical protein